MRRTTDTYKEANKFGLGVHGFTDGSPGVTAPTIIHAADMDAYQEELARVVEHLGHNPLDSAQYGQASAAIQLARSSDAMSEPTKMTVTDAGFSPRCFCGSWGIGATALYSGGANGKVCTRVFYGNDTQSWGSMISASNSYTGTFNACLYAPSTNVVVFAGTGGEIQTMSSSVLTRRKTGGSDIVSLVMDGTDVFYALDVGGHVWQAINPTGTWTDLGAVLPTNARSLAVGGVSGAGDTFLCCASNEIYRSVNFCASFTQITCPGVPASVAYNPDLKSWLAVGSNGGNYVAARSDDNGVTFSQTASNSGAGFRHCHYIPGGWVCSYMDATVSNPGGDWENVVMMTSDGIRWRMVNRCNGQLADDDNSLSVVTLIPEIVDQSNAQYLILYGYTGNIFRSRRINHFYY